MCDNWINVLLQTSVSVGSLHIVNWNARWNNETAASVFSISYVFTQWINIFEFWIPTVKILWRSWLNHCVSSRKVAGFIPDRAIAIFYWHDPTGRTIAPGLTQTLTEMSTMNISCGQRWPVRRADNLITFMCQLSWNLSLKPQGLPWPVMGLLYLLP
jgi:hypothetical protein